ncbi:MAG TPA: hypothetical protein VGP72_27840 [Planctomycetota bacterium]
MAIRFLPHVLVPVLALSAHAEQFAAKHEFKVLYVGVPGERQDDFVQFLKSQFTAVEIAEFGAFQPGALPGIDMVLVDFDGDARKDEPLAFPADYARPTVTIGLMGSYIGSRLGLKTGYM